MQRNGMPAPTRITKELPMSWRVARSLDVLLEEINAAAPRRSKVSDGSIGDAAHATRSSDHNPWLTYGGQGIVRARDFTHDPAGGLDCNDLAKALAELIALGGHPACRSGAYVIWQGRIFSFDRRHEGWRPYTGSNPHDHHLHLSVATDPAGFDSSQMWGVMIQEDPMAQYDEKLNQIAEDAQAGRLAAEKAVRLAEGIRRRALAQTTRLRKRLDQAVATGTATKVELEELRDQVDDIEIAVNADED